MKSLIPMRFRDGDTLDPDALNRNFQRMRRDLEDVANQRYTYSALMVDLSDIDNTDNAAEMDFKINVPAPTYADIDVIAAEAVLYASDDDITITIDNDGGETISFDVDGAGVTTRASAALSFEINNAAGSELSISVTASGTWNIARGYVLLHLRHDRHVGGATPGASLSYPSLDASQADDPAPLNTFFTDYGTEVTADTNNAEQLRCMFFNIARNVTAIPAAHEDFRIPDFGGKPEFVDVYNHGDVGANIAFDFRDSASSLFASTVNGAGLGVLASDNSGALGNTQPNNDPDDPNDDYIMRAVYSGAGTIYNAWAVIWWKE